MRKLQALAGLGTVAVAVTLFLLAFGSKRQPYLVPSLFGQAPADDPSLPDAAGADFGNSEFGIRKLEAATRVPNPEPRSAKGGPNPEDRIPNLDPPRADRTPSVLAPTISERSPLPAAVTPALTSALSASELETRLQQAQQAAAQGHVVEALRRLSEIYFQPQLTPAQKLPLVRQMEPMSQVIFFSPGEPALADRYAVQAGDTLQRIAQRWNISWQYLARLNGITDPRRIQPGQRLKIVRGPFEALVDLSDFELVVSLDGLWVRSYPIGIGKENSTPLGTFTVQNKVENPRYDGPEGHFAPEDPNNPVGEHWIDIGDGYGIHGTIEPETIGQQASLGCIRLRPEDVIEVYYFLTVGSPVQIRP